MNKPIKATQKITDSNSLLNKFIVFKNDYSSNLFLHYVYKVNKTHIFSYRITYNKNEIDNCELVCFHIEHYNFDIDYSLKYISYNIYIF